MHALGGRKNADVVYQAGSARYEMSKGSPFSQFDKKIVLDLCHSRADIVGVVSSMAKRVLIIRY
jgi:hypothetical protein